MPEPGAAGAAQKPIASSKAAVWTTNQSTESVKAAGEMPPSVVTKKNRKVRRLRERYPEVRCKVFYQRDYLSLVTKYGLENVSG